MRLRVSGMDERVFMVAGSVGSGVRGVNWVEAAAAVAMMEEDSMNDRREIRSASVLVSESLVPVVIEEYSAVVGIPSECGLN